MLVALVSFVAPIVITAVGAALLGNEFRLWFVSRKDWA